MFIHHHHPLLEEGLFRYCFYSPFSLNILHALSKLIRPQLLKDLRGLNKLSFPACCSFILHFMFSFSPFHVFLSFPLHPLYQSISLHPSFPLHSSDFISAHSCSSNPEIYHLKHLDHSTSHRPSSPSSFSSSSSSFSFCWYFPSVLPSGEECCQYILWALVAVYLLLFFTSSFLVFFSDHPTTCHCNPHHTPMQGPSPQPGVPLPNRGTTDSQCKSQCLGRNCKLPFIPVKEEVTLKCIYSEK